jgi:hypothetical protein
MSILDNNQQEPSAERKAARIKFLNSAISQELIKSWNEGWDLVWGHSNPQDVLDALGEDASEVFDINEQTVIYLNNVLSGRKQEEVDSILAKAATKPATQTDENGNVTII